MALGVIIFGGALGVPVGARSAGPDARGKTVPYLTFGIDFNYTDGLEFEYQTALLDGIKNKAAEAGLVMQVFGCKGDPQLQLTQILDAVTKKPDALLINPVDAKLIVTGVKRANEANIPIFIIENPPPEGKFLGLVDFDNEAGGAMGADELAKLIGEKGVALEALGLVGSNQPQLRHKGFTERMKEKYPDIEVHSLTMEWVADNANKMVLQALTQNPNIMGVFSDSDQMVPGVQSALRQIGKLVPVGQQGHVAIVGVNGTPGALDRIRKGSQDASVGKDPNGMAGIVLNQIIAYFEGKPFDAKGQTKPILITKDNVDDPNLWGNCFR
ncbi:MAG TPA: sugar ABC transporter substrate-binding protein [Candidatus Sulfotelmatobacter sp.]|nr:sugar ABC transporter substrate-binding protein [Candidatus Sulfotelmatobacter sp.]